MAIAQACVVWAAGMRLIEIYIGTELTRTGQAQTVQMLEMNIEWGKDTLNRAWGYLCLARAFGLPPLTRRGLRHVRRRG